LKLLIARMFIKEKINSDICNTNTMSKVKINPENLKLSIGASLLKIKYASKRINKSVETLVRWKLTWLRGTL